MQRAVLASLLTRLGAVVTVDTIIEDLWGGTPPRTAVATVRNYVLRLRKVFPEPVLHSTPFGYRLAAAPDDVDAHRFTALVARARAEDSHELFDEALALWRGEPLSDIGGVPLRTVQAPKWEEAYLAALEDAMDSRLRRGQHTELVAELTELVARHPLRERLCGQLMIALYRCGRAAEALAHYRRLRAELVTGLGMEPGPELRRIEAAVLREDGDVLAVAERDGQPGSAYRPRDLPSPPFPFVGRDGEVAELLDRFGDAAAGAVHCFVYGQGGCGKSALAVHVAHRLADRYPDGVLYADLGGSTPDTVPTTASEVIAGLIHDFGGARPSGGGDLATLVRTYRARLRGRRVLIILDNAVTAGQVRPALPDEPGCAAIVTSRAAISRSGAVFPLDALDAPMAVELLRRTVGARKVDAEPAAAAELAALCGRLPLALRLIGTRAALRPHWPLRTWVGMLADERDRLDQLRHEDVDVRASFLIGLDGLRTGADPAGHDAAELFPLLGLLTPPHFTPALAAGLTGWPVERAESALERLLDAQMVFSPGPGRYAPFDLIALLAREQAAELAAEERRGRLRRAMNWYLAAVRRCSEAATGARTDYGLPQDDPVDAIPTLRFGRYAEVRSWLDRELPVLVAVLRQAARARLSEHAETALAVLRTVAFYLNSAFPWTERSELAAMLIDADIGATAFAYTNLAIVEGQRGNLDIAVGLADKARAALGDEDHYTGALLSITEGIILGIRGRYAESIEHYERALAAATAHRYPTFEVMALNNLGDVYLRVGREDEALAVLERALARNRGIGHQVYIAINMNTILQVRSVLGDHYEVVRRAPEVHAQHEALGNAHQLAEHLLTVANSLRALGDDEAADEHVARARACLEDISTRERVALSTLFEQLVLEVPGTGPVSAPPPLVPGPRP